MERSGKTVAPSAAGGLRHIQTIIESGGQIMIGTVKPIKGAAVAHDGTRTIVMLKRGKDEQITTLLQRLDAAIALARSTGERVDEINKPDSGVTYSY